ncbi:MAG: arginase family protein [Acidobacteriota bacterium]
MRNLFIEGPPCVVLTPGDLHTSGGLIAGTAGQTTHSVGGTPVPPALAVPFHVGDFVAEVESSEPSLVYAADCMAPLGVLAGLHRRGVSPYVVWLDAHGDFNTWDTTPSGYIGGMPVAMLTGRGEQTIVEALELPVIDEGRFLISDARDLDPGEGVALARSRVRVVPLGKIAQELPPDLPIYVHLNVDVVTPSEMPALRFPARGGPSLAAVEISLRSLARTGRVACTSVACTWEPENPAADAAVAATKRLIAALREGVVSKPGP